MKKMFLSSSFCDTVQLFRTFVGEEVVGKSVTFITTASKVEEYKGYVDDDRAAFESLGIRIEELDISTVSRTDMMAKFAENDFVYVSGGNTFYLLQEMQKSGADVLLKEQIAGGKMYIGASAGSLVLSADLSYVQTMDDASKASELTNFKALNLIDFYPVVHYGDFPFAEIAEQIYLTYKAQLPLIAISNTQVITVVGTTVSVLGDRVAK